MCAVHRWARAACASASTATSARARPTAPGRIPATPSNRSNDPKGQTASQIFWSDTHGAHRMSINLKTLIGKLNDTCRQSAERAASLCLARGHYEVDVEHLFIALLEHPRSDVALIAQ